jgi:CDP-glycerol glycerophosphotransferase (TagB/SpsB family)
VVETGWPKLDPLFEPGAGVPRIGRERPLVLYASTFSAGLTSTGALHGELRRLAATGAWDWIVTFHPKTPREVVERYRAIESPHLRVADGDDVVPLLRDADVLLSDTSSIVSEFLVLHKPVVCFRNRAPGPHLIDVRSAAEIAPALARALERPAPLLAAIRAYAERIHPYRDGRSSQRVLAATEEFLARGRAGLCAKPLNLWRRWQARRALGFYRLG